MSARFVSLTLLGLGLFLLEGLNRYGAAKPPDLPLDPRIIVTPQTPPASGKPTAGRSDRAAIRDLLMPMPTPNEAIARKRAAAGTCCADGGCCAHSKCCCTPAKAKPADAADVGAAMPGKLPGNHTVVMRMCMVEVNQGALHRMGKKARAAAADLTGVARGGVTVSVMQTRQVEKSVRALGNAGVLYTLWDPAIAATTGQNAQFRIRSAAWVAAVPGQAEVRVPVKFGVDVVPVLGDHGSVNVTGGMSLHASDGPRPVAWTTQLGAELHPGQTLALRGVGQPHAPAAGRTGDWQMVLLMTPYVVPTAPCDACGAVKTASPEHGHAGSARSRGQGVPAMVRATCCGTSRCCAGGECKCAAGGCKCCDGGKCKCSGGECKCCGNGCKCCSGEKCKCAAGKCKCCGGACKCAGSASATSKADSGCPYLREQAAKKAAAAEVGGSVLDNIGKLERAERDYRTAEHYRRTGHPGTACMYYERARRACPGSRCESLATARLKEVQFACWMRAMAGTADALEQLMAHVYEARMHADSDATSPSEETGSAEEEEQPPTQDPPPDTPRR